jgi:ribonuclease HI
MSGLENPDGLHRTWATDPSYLTDPPIQFGSSPMHTASPHYLLFTELSASGGTDPQWRFVLQSIGGETFLAADDVEPGTSENRLELLAVVRGLEALDEPSRVTLLTTSRYVNRGIQRGLSQWRERKWRWERFGQLVAIRNQDLWQRVDRAMQFHDVEFLPAHLAGASNEASRAANITRVAIGAADCGDRDRSRIEAAWPEAEQSAAARWRFDGGESNLGLRGPFFRTLNRLRQGVLAPLAAIWRPAFTRAA